MTPPCFLPLFFVGEPFGFPKGGGDNPTLLEKPGAINYNFRMMQEAKTADYNQVSWRQPIRFLARYKLQLFFLVSVVAAYHFSLTTVGSTLSLETPLAYIVLVPFISAWLALMISRRPAKKPVVVDPQIDFLIALPFLVFAVVLIILLPVQMSLYYWFNRVDLLSLPFFVAGGVILLFGVRAFWRMFFPIVYLIFAWPALYLYVLTDLLDFFTNLTISSVQQLTKIVPLASATSSTDPSIFSIPSPGGPFLVSIGSACAGLNSVLGFGLLAVAFLYLVKGKWYWKLAWLGSGLLIVYVVNIVRVISIFLVGRWWGAGLALGGFHSVVGLILFNLVLLGMLLILPKFNLTLTAMEPSPPFESKTRPKRSAPLLSILFFAAVAILLMFGNAGLRDYAQFGNYFSNVPNLKAFSVVQPKLDSWSLNYVDSYTWARQYFGNNSTFERFSYVKTTPAVPGISPLWVDVVRTDNQESLSAYDVQSCYSFHDYVIKNIDRVDLGNGVTGTILDYYVPPTKSQWVSVYWTWPVKMGEKTYHERITLIAVRSEGQDISGYEPPIPILKKLAYSIVSFFTSQNPTEDAAFKETNAQLSTFSAKLIQKVIQDSLALP